MIILLTLLDFSKILCIICSFGINEMIAAIFLYKIIYFCNSIRVFLHTVL